MPNGEDISISVKTKLRLYQNDNYIGVFDTLEDIDRYLRQLCMWQRPHDVDGYMEERFNAERWTIVKSDFISYERKKEA